MVPTILPSLIRREILELDRLVETCLRRYGRREELIRSGAEDILADSLATCLHSFYTGLERVLEAIVREIDGARSRSREWHRELLQAVSVDHPGLRPRVLSEEAFKTLEEYRAFRHLFRHLYTHTIDPMRVFALMESLGKTWRLAKRDLENFLLHLEECGHE